MPSLEELVSSEESRSPRPFPWRRVAIAAALIVLLLLAIFLPPYINLGKYRRRITASMSEALGRPVYVGGMQLRLLPTPGIVMTDLTVDEDPTFGYEPALHAASVVASLRLTSLWRGRLEVSRISLDEANLNIVRNAAGEWSIGSILLRASQISNAPTAQRIASARPRFPYIEATNARIDFKDGAEKKPFSLMNAEFSMWQANADEWRLRLRAQPVRTDLQLHLSDTGELNVEGSLHRASALDAMPVSLRGEWSGAQLGQVTRLLAGMDSGWRGDLDLTTTIRGNIGDLQLQSRLQVADLRRQEFQPPSTVDVDATCRSQYHHLQHTLDNITCFWPVSSGHLLLTGEVRGWQSPQADLQLEINSIPASFPIHFLQLIRPGAQNMSVGGIVNGSFHLITAHRPLVTGTASATGVSLRYSGGSLNLPAMRFAAPPAQPAPAHHGKHSQPAPPPQNYMELLPISIPMGEPQPLVADSRFTRAGFELHLTGPASLARLLPAFANLGVLQNSANLVAPRGRATLNLTAAGQWMRPIAETGAGNGITTSGSIVLDAAQLRPAFLPAPVDVQSADVSFDNDRVSWQNVVLTYQKMPMRGSLQFPILCTDAAGCPATFTLALGPAKASAIETALGVNPNSGFLGKLLSLGDNHPGWPTLEGQVQCERLDLGPLPLQNAAASLRVAGNALTLSSFDAAALGGNLHWTGSMTIDDGTPHWKLKARLTGASSTQAAELFEEKWGPGQINADATLSMTGYRVADLAGSATGDFSFTWQNGALPSSPPSSPPGSAPAKATTVSTAPAVPFERWTGKGTIASRTLTIASGGVARAGRTSALHGSISFDRDLDLTLETRRGVEKITGTLVQPVVTAPRNLDDPLVNAVAHFGHSAVVHVDLHRIFREGHTMRDMRVRRNQHAPRHRTAHALERHRHLGRGVAVVPDLHRHQHLVLQLLVRIHAANR